MSINSTVDNLLVNEDGSFHRPVLRESCVMFSEGNNFPKFEIPVFRLPNDNEIKLEIRIPHATVTGCPFCSSDFNSSSFQSKSSYERHMIKVHKFKIVSCNLSCRYCEFDQSHTKHKYPIKVINQHIMQVHADAPSPARVNTFLCPQCDRVFPSALSRGNHVRAKHNSSEIQKVKKVIKEFSTKLREESSIFPNQKSNRNNSLQVKTLEKVTSKQSQAPVNFHNLSVIRELDEQLDNTGDLNVINYLLKVNLLNLNSNPVREINTCLTDEIIHIYFSLLCRHNKDWSSLHPQISSISDKALISHYLSLVPLTHKLFIPFLVDSHWILFYIDFQLFSINCFNSLRHLASPIVVSRIYELASQISGVSSTQFSMNYPPHNLLQLDSTSCGAFICYFARSVVLDSDAVSRQIDSKSVRDCIAQDITDPFRLSPQMKGPVLRSKNAQSQAPSSKTSSDFATSLPATSQRPAFQVSSPVIQRKFKSNVDLDLSPLKSLVIDLSPIKSDIPQAPSSSPDFILDTSPILNVHPAPINWRDTVFEGILTENELKYQEIFSKIGPDCWNEFEKVSTKIIETIRGEKKPKRHQNKNYRPKPECPSRQAATPDTAVGHSSQRHIPQPPPGFSSKEASKVQRAYKMSKKGVVRRILGNSSPSFKAPAEEVEAYYRQQFAGQPQTKDSSQEFQQIAEEYLSKKPVAETFSRPFAASEVAHTLKSLSNSAPGDDGVVYSELAKFDPNGRIFAWLYNFCKEARKVPTSWKSSIVTLIHKKGDPENLGNWRPISMSNTIYKLYTKLWANRLLLELPSRLSDEQKGFMPKEGCLEHIFTLENCLSEAKSKRKTVAIAWLDLCNAFGSVPHALIRANLNQMGFPTEFLDIVSDIYTDSNCRVKTGGNLTQQIPVSRGVKQGDPLSPFLFNIAIEPVLRLIKKEFGDAAFTCSESQLSVLAYCDDLVFMTNNSKSMQSLLEKVEILMNKMRISINAAKCSTLLLEKGKVAPTTFHLASVDLPALNIGDFYEYLGRQVGVKHDRTPTDMLKTFIADLHKIEKCLLSDWQKLDAIKTFLIPRLGFILRNGDIPRGILKQVDGALTHVIRCICRLPKSSTLHYIRSPIERGGLGILGPMEEQEIQLLTHAFRLLSSPVANIKKLAWNSLLAQVKFKLGHQPTSEEVAEYLSGSTEDKFKHMPSQGSCLWNRVRQLARPLNKKIKLSFQVNIDEQEAVLNFKHPLHDHTHVHSNGRDFCFSALRTSVMAFHSTMLITQCKDQGRAFDQISRDKINSKFLSDGKFISHPTFRWIHAARLNQLPVNAAPGRGNRRPSEDQLCRRCNEGQRETLAHVLCHCRPQLARAITTRHDMVVENVALLLRKQFPKAKLSIGKVCSVAGRNLKPDIVMIDEAKSRVAILDIRCPFEGSTNSFENARISKREKYDIEKLAFNMKGFDCICDAIVVGALGSWDPLNDQVLRQLGLSSLQIGKIKRPIIQDVTEVSKCIFWEHILGDRYFNYGRFAKSAIGDLVDA
jgi:uncharacterized C2H2 Zn-finger protein